MFVHLLLELHHEGKCGWLNKPLRGTKDAVDAWEHECANTLIEFGFAVGSLSARIFKHGDDFTVSGTCHKFNRIAEDLGTITSSKCGRCSVQAATI